MSIPWTSPTACLRKKINGELAQQNGSRAVSAPRDKDEQNTVWRIYHSEGGANTAHKTEAKQMHLQSRTDWATYLSCNSAFLLRGIVWKAGPMPGGIDVETGMAVVVGDKTHDSNYHIPCVQAFVVTCERLNE